jgi:glycerol-3-phosphate acyltransferase PlsY
MQTPSMSYEIARAGVVLGAYLLGSIPFGYVLVRTFLHEDIRKTGSGNIGATNVIRTGKKGLGIATLLLDLAKGYVAVMIAHCVASYFGMNVQHAMVAAAVAATVGHIFTVWLGFKGGKGVATGLGVFLALAPMVALCSLLVFIAVFVFSKYVSLASICAAAVLPLFAAWLVPAMRDPWSLGGMIFIPLLVIVKHEQNIKRLMAGTESRFMKKKPA